MVHQTSLTPAPPLEQRILLFRSTRVMLDRDLAALYGVRPIALRQQVKRNQKRFPADFTFQLTRDEASILVSQNVIPSQKSLGGSLPFVFTQEGVAMLSSVLRSPRAIAVNVEIMRAFVRYRRLLGSNDALARRLDELEQKYEGRFKNIFRVIRRLMNPRKKPRPPIGFRPKPALGAGVRQGYHNL